MTRPAGELSTRSGSDGAAVGQAVTVIMGVVVGLTFLFGFGRCLALRLGVPICLTSALLCRRQRSRGLLRSWRSRQLAPRHGEEDDVMAARHRRLSFFVGRVNAGIGRWSAQSLTADGHPSASKTTTGSR
jgi:hypothetical protein